LRHNPDKFFDSVSSNTATTISTMRPYPDNWAVIIPMANEEADFHPFREQLTLSMDQLEGGSVYFVVDNASRDKTLELCREAGAKDPRFHTIWAPENRNVVDAYMRGFRETVDLGYEIIVEMDGGLSHDPRALPAFLRALHEGNDCAFGSRYINGGSMVDSSWKRRFLSKGGSILARVVLNVHFSDMTSGYQAFRREVLVRLLEVSLLSEAHFYQTEVRYLLRREKAIEVPIHYRAPSPSVSKNAIRNSFAVLAHYALRRFSGRAISLATTPCHH
jgi:dolichol-phosphate mannosyltransferase